VNGVASERARAGDVIVIADIVGTVAFTLTAVSAAVVFSTAAQWVGAITAMALFAVGVFAFIWSFWHAVQRSREEQIGVMQIYLLLGDPTPARVRRIMLAMLAIQVTVALVTALARSESEDGSPGHVAGRRHPRADVRPRAQRSVERVPRGVPAASRPRRRRRQSRGRHIPHCDRQE
jgi:hypothetical protein